MPRNKAEERNMILGMLKSPKYKKIEIYDGECEYCCTTIGVTDESCSYCGVESHQHKVHKFERIVSDYSKKFNHNHLAEDFFMRAITNPTYFENYCKEHGKGYFWRDIKKVKKNLPNLEKKIVSELGQEFFDGLGK